MFSFRYREMMSRSNLQRKKQHRHSGIFRVADLGPGTMPRGKYPESPAPAGSHALISRTPTPGGMLHANLGLPRPPPRNFACLTTPEPVKESPSDTGATSKEKNNIVIPEFSAWLALVLEQCRAENIRKNAAPGRHAPCQSRAATTSPSQLSTSPPATTSKTNPTAPPQCPSRAVASRQRSRNAGGMRRLAAEIPDVFIPLSRNDVRNDDDIFDSDVFPAGDSFTGSGAPPQKAPCRLRRDGTRRFLFWGAGALAVACLTTP